MNYSVAIRTLGKGGEKYQKCLDSIASQTIKPDAVIIYLADGYPAPKETIGFEKIIYVKKGMVAQRALPYDEIQSDYILFLDDDVFLAPDSVEKLYNELITNSGDVISPIVFHNNQASIKDKIIRSLTGREVCRLTGDKWANKVLKTGGFSYNNNPSKAVYESQTNAGPCIFCRKDIFVNMRLEEELWLDQTPYAFPEDQVTFYKMYKQGNKILSSYDSGIIHMDASSTISNPLEKTMKVIYSEYRNKLIFWHRFIFLPSTIPGKFLASLAFAYSYGIQVIKYSVYFLLGKKQASTSFFNGIRDAISFINSDSYKSLPRIPK